MDCKMGNSLKMFFSKDGWDLKQYLQGWVESRKAFNFLWKVEISIFHAVGMNRERTNHCYVVKGIDPWISNP